MSKTKLPLRTFAMGDEWEAFAAIASTIVPESERPMTANRTSEWQRTALIRAIAEGRATVEWVGKVEGVGEKGE